MNKWPACIISGKSATPEQAYEIIRVVDASLNMHDLFEDLFNEKIPNSYNPRDVAIRCSANNKLEELRGSLPLNYLDVHLISSHYIGGAHGWIRPSGEISSVHNIGKWPSYSEIQSDLKLIAERFPFLDMNVSIGNREHTEDDLNVNRTYHVENGSVSIIDTECKPVDEAIKMHHPHLNIDNCFNVEPSVWVFRMTEDEVVDALVKENVSGFCAIELAQVRAIRNEARELLEEAVAFAMSELDDDGDI